MKYLIGLPIYKRDWILREWFDCIEKQTVPLSDIGFLFLTSSQEKDPETYKILFEWQAAHPEVAYFDIIEEPKETHKTHTPGVRAWKREDFVKLATFRNLLLDRVRTLQPEQYLSLDSDMLMVDPTTMETLKDNLLNYNAVSPLAYMSPLTKRHPNVLTWHAIPGHGTYRRDDYPLGTVFQSDVIMGVVMMDPETYTKSRYLYHLSGEDVGWAYSMHREGLTMGLVSTVYVPHVMHSDLAPNKKETYKDAPGVYPVFKQKGDNRGVDLSNCNFSQV